MQLWMRRNPLSFLFAAVVAAFFAGVIGAILTDTPREPVAPPRTQTRVEPPYQPRSELPDAKPQRVEAPKQRAEDAARVVAIAEDGVEVSGGQCCPRR